MRKGGRPIWFRKSELWMISCLFHVPAMSSDFDRECYSLAPMIMAKISLWKYSSYTVERIDKKGTHKERVSWQSNLQLAGQPQKD